MPADQLHIPANAQGPTLARAFTANLLAAWNISPPHDYLLLATSELVTNAVLHGRAPICVTVSISNGLIRLEVADSGLSTPHLRTPGQHGGFGLRLISKISRAWGVIHTGHGKIVWCECPIRAAG